MKIKAAARSSAGFTLAAWIAATVAVLCALLLSAPFIRAAYGGETESGGQAKASESGPAHPSKAICRVCEVRGAAHGKEEVAGWRQHDGHTYYFCSDACVEAFDADPAAFSVFKPRPAPPIHLKFLDGTESTLEPMVGDVVLVDFWATWCKPCLKSMPEIQELHEEFSGSGFRAIGVAMDTSDDKEKKVREFVAKKKLTYPIAIDREEGAAWEAFHVPVLPAMYLVGRDGAVAKQWVGKFDFDEVKRAIREAMAVKADG